MASLNVSMPDKMRAFVDAQTEAGQFSTPSEYIRHLIREDAKRKAAGRLEELLLEGLDGGPSEPMTDQDWAELRRRAHERIEEKTKKGHVKKSA
ncbi:MAG: type II toxin-antitoxin system ParD family antitoxin [Myxococcales bacterium]|nr:type II toxin-antitoxin system ParD family antitoxin [Myxococcales bacterium]